jgi:hypothetical protein
MIAEKRPFALVGIGVETCELVVTHLRGNNMRMKNFYCESNPQRQAYEAGDALWDSLRPKR